MWNDMPYKTYDFQAPLGEFGQVRDSYHLLRRFHMFLHDFGPMLAPMPAVFPDAKPSGKNDATTLRYSVRSDGKSGFLFVSNYQRGADMPAKPDTQFQFHLPSGSTVNLPADAPATVPANTCFVWPFNIDVGGARLLSATAQPVCQVHVADTTYTFFCATPGVDANFCFPRDDVSIDETGTGTLVEMPHESRINAIKPTGLSIRLHSANGRRQVIYVYKDSDFAEVWRARMEGEERVVRSPLNLAFENLCAYVTGTPQIMTISVFPQLPDPFAGRGDSRNFAPVTSPFVTYAGVGPSGSLLLPTLRQIQPAGAPRNIVMGSQKVAEQPTDADFEGDKPAVFSIRLPAYYDEFKHVKVILRLQYTGDVARIYAGDKLVDDNFYNGTPFDLGLWRLPPDTTELTLKILPLKKDAPIYLAKWPDFQGKDSLASVEKVELIQQQTVMLVPNK
jgi:hypothetical protein